MVNIGGRGRAMWETLGSASPILWLHNASPVILAAATWISLSPFFVWGSLVPLIIAAIVATAVTVTLLVSPVRPSLTTTELVGAIVLSLFLVYITAQPRTDGGHALWIFVLPTLWALVLLTDSQRGRCFSAFATIFAISLIPGILVSLWLAAGLPIVFNEAPHPNTIMAAGGVRILSFLGALFNESNGVPLPWGGVLFRLCGVYDEPGTVGTNAALLLIALRFPISDWRACVLYVGGVLSFSLAFAVLATIGVIGHAFLTRRVPMLLLIVPIAAAASMSLGWFVVPAGNVSPPVLIQQSASPASPAAVGTQRLESSTTPSSVTATPRPSPTLRTLAVVRPDLGLRQSDVVDNRVLAPMRVLWDEYLRSGPETLLLGIASDASVVRGGLSQTWLRILTNHGLLGFALLFVGIALLSAAALRRSHLGLACALFLGLFLLNVYQRPVIWLPYPLLILVCGAAAATLRSTRANET
jgi:hypothetical protein